MFKLQRLSTGVLLGHENSRDRGHGIYWESPGGKVAALVCQHKHNLLINKAQERHVDRGSPRQAPHQFSKFQSCCLYI